MTGSWTQELTSGKKPGACSREERTWSAGSRLPSEKRNSFSKNLEQPAQLRLTPLTHHKETYIRIKDASVSYGSHQVIRNFSMELKRGERILLQGKNGLRKIQYSENDPARRRHAPSRGKGFLCTGTA